ncbi:MAG: GNAT family N-acetyltransferase [Nocardioides sp.]
MTALARPDVRLHASWAAAILDFDGDTVHGAGLWHLEDEDYVLDEAGCALVVERLADYTNPTAVLPDGIVASDYFWVTEGEPAEVIGFLAVRHELTAWLLVEGGHIGYSIRPSRRREGHATRALALAVRRAVELGIERALVTCDDDNLASARTIELNGGVHEDTRNGKRRYWIDTSGR